MPGNVVGTALNYGFAGTVSRIGKDPIIESRPVKTGTTSIEFGKAVILNTDDTFQLAGSTLTAANFAGVAYAGAKQGLAYNAGTGEIDQNGSYAADTPCAVVKEGVVSVKVVDSGTPTAGGAVYVRKVVDADNYPDEALGDFRTAADGSNTVQITNACWNTNRKDANGVAELKLKYVNN